MPRPTPTTPFQEELYSYLEPLASQDESLGWPLLIYCGAIAAMFDQIELYARDSDDGRPGWSIILDPATAPGTDELKWLGNFVGVTIPSGLTLDQQREWVRNTTAFKRGTVGAMRAAVQQRLTGNKTVYIDERYGDDAYLLRVTTITEETSDAAAAEAAARSQKPAGIILTFQTVPMNSYDQILVEYSTYADLAAAFLTYNGLRNNSPGA